MIEAIEFHTGLADPVGFACRLLRKAMRTGTRIVCTAPPARLDELDRSLWTFDERDFVPHVRVPGAAADVARRTPIWLMPAADAESAGRVLVNLDADVPADPRAFARVIELVAADPDAAARGRERWRAYRARGLEIRHHTAPRGH
jgi:DNA polymerase-3 subunit chi